jgi:hypothetical protein
MQETWLRPNRRVLFLGMVPLVVLGLLAWLLSRADLPGIFRVTGLASETVCLLLMGLLVHHLRTPRIAYRSGEVLFHLRWLRPIRVPLPLVEAFFLGAGPADLPFCHDDQTTTNLVARLTQKEHDWSNVPMKHALGSWHNGYVTIRGTWCEPLSEELVLRMNRRLSEVSQATRVSMSNASTTPVSKESTSATHP